MSIACSIGIFFGILVSSIPVAAILSVYIGNQLSAIFILATVFTSFIEPSLLALIIGITITTIFLEISIISFSRRQF
jgi:hypothetical protein